MILAFLPTTNWRERSVHHRLQ